MSAKQRFDLPVPLSAAAFARRDVVGEKTEELPCGNAARPIDGDCLTPIYGGGGRSLDFRVRFVL